jgi:dipeptidyl aminopeptidase/acylaminoacyl peptidase
LKKIALITIFFILLFSLTLVIYLSFFAPKPLFTSPLTSFEFQKRPPDLKPYSFENLQKRKYFPSEIKLEKTLEEDSLFTSFLFSYSSEGRKITGMANLPKRQGTYPVAILMRGFVDPQSYITGVGTINMATFLAQNGFITLAPDFLGYGGSDPDFPHQLLARFSRPINIIVLLNSLENLNKTLDERNLATVNPQKIVFWGHSNGGQIALSVLEITGRPIPTSLWAPVSAPFPESILYFTPEMEDEGKSLKEIVANFEKKYKSKDYSITNFFDQISAPIILHQGMADEAIPIEWSSNLYKTLKNLGKDITYYQYPGENHNFNFTRGSSNIARNRDLNFFKKHL